MKYPPFAQSEEHYDKLKQLTHVDETVVTPPLEAVHVLGQAAAKLGEQVTHTPLIN